MSNHPRRFGADRNQNNREFAKQQKRERLAKIEKDYSPRGIPAPCGCEYEAGSWTVCDAHRRDPESAPWTDDDSTRREEPPEDDDA